MAHMKISFIDLRKYGYVGEELENGYIYCPFMPFSHETDEELQEAISKLEKEYEEKKGV